MQAELAEPAGAGSRSWVDVLTAEFFAEYFERRPFVARGAHPDPAALISADTLEHLLGAPPGSRHSYVRLAKMLENGTRDQTKLDPEFRLSAVVPRYRDGYSIVFDEINYRWPPIYAQCVELQKTAARHAGVVVRGKATCALFLTPPHARATPLHYDCKDVFVVQVDGSKTWRLHAPPVEAPMRNSVEREIDPARVGPCVLEVTLQPGDVLYMPRGFVHSPVTEAARSLHLSFGLATVTWSEVVLAMMEERAAFRRSIPKRVLDAGPADPAVRELVAAVVAQLDDPVAASRAFARAAAADVAAEVHVAAGRLADTVRNVSAEVAERTLFEKRYGARFRLERSAGEIAIAFPGGRVTVPAACSETVARIAETDRFTVADVQRAMTFDAARRLVVKLLDEGFLRLGDRA